MYVYMLQALALLLATSFASADPGCAPPAACNSSNVALGVLLDLSTGGTLELHQQLFCAAQLAAQHATARNGSVVPELAALSEQLHVHAHPYDTLGPTAEQGFAASRAAIDAGVAALLGPLRSEVAPTYILENESEAWGLAPLGLGLGFWWGLLCR